MRLLLSIMLVLLAILVGYSRVSADSPVFDEPQYGNNFMCAQHALAAEMRYQPYHALLEGARVLHTKGECYRDGHWLTSWALAQSIIRQSPTECRDYYACVGYFLFETIEPSVREPIALAVHTALTESPPIPRYHMDALNAPLNYVWLSPIACPNGIITFADSTMRFC